MKLIRAITFGSLLGAVLFCGCFAEPPPIEADAEGTGVLILQELTSEKTDDPKIELDEFTFELSKDAINFTKFESTLKKNFSKVHIKDVGFDAESFINFIKDMKQIQILILENVMVSGTFTRIKLPLLQKFIFHHKEAEFITEIIENPATLKNVLFFDKENPWEVGEIWNLGVDITVSTHRGKLLEISHKKKEFMSNLRYSQEILKNLKSASVPLLSLTLGKCAIEPKFIPNSVTFLNLIRIRGVTWNDFSPFENLTDLYFYPDTLDTLSVSFIPKKLKTLYMRFQSLDFKPNSTVSLDSLTLHSTLNCKRTDKWTNKNNLGFGFNPDLFNIRRIAVIEDFCRHISTHELLNTILKTDVEWIYFDTLWKLKSADPTQNFTIIQLMDEFLSIAGYPDNENATIHFKMEKLNERWFGNLLNKEMKRALVHNLMGIYKFKYESTVMMNELQKREITLEDEDSQNSLKFFGNEIDFKMFIDNSTGFSGGKKTIQLKNIGFLGRSFSNYLRTQEGIQTLIFDNVKVFENFERVDLPQLRNFVFSHEYNEEFRRELAFRPDALKNLLFFDKNGSWDLGNLWAQDVNVGIKISHDEMIGVSHEKDQFISRLKYTDLILKNIESVFSVALYDCKVDPNFVPKDVVSLDLYYMENRWQDFEPVFSTLANLKMLYFYPQADKDIFISYIPLGLRYLYLRYATEIRTNSLVEINSLSLRSCEWSNEFGLNFHLHFNVKRLAIIEGFCANPNDLDHEILDSTLKMTNIEWIFFDNFQRKNPEELPKSSIIVNEIEEFLTKAGLLSDYSDSFILEKVDGVWTGKPLNWEDKETLVDNLSGHFKFL